MPPQKFRPWRIQRIGLFHVLSCTLGTNCAVALLSDPSSMQTDPRTTNRGTSPREPVTVPLYVAAADALATGNKASAGTVTPTLPRVRRSSCRALPSGSVASRTPTA